MRLLYRGLRRPGAEVLILGAGLAGMSTAYELGKLGYHCTILEARTRPGGRCHTIRKGTASEEEGSTQVAAYDEGMYFNPGPMRIPHHHSTTLGYAKELGVPLKCSSRRTTTPICTRPEQPGRRIRSTVVAR